MCKIIQTGHLPPITPDNSLKAINRGNSARKQRPRKSPITIARLALGQRRESESPGEPAARSGGSEQLDQLRLNSQERQKVELRFTGDSIPPLGRALAGRSL